MFYQMPPAAVAPAVVFDSMAVSRDRRAFGRNVFRPAVYEPTDQERREYLALIAELEERNRFQAIVESINGGCDLNPTSFNDADAITVTGCC